MCLLEPFNMHGIYLIIVLVIYGYIYIVTSGLKRAVTIAVFIA